MAGRRPVRRGRRDLGLGHTEAEKQVPRSRRQEARSLCRYIADGATLATSTPEGAVQLWDTQTLQSAVALRACQAVASGILSNGKTLAVGVAKDWDQPGQIVLWDVEKGTQMAAVPGHSRSISSLTFSPDGKLLASGSYDPP